MQNTRDIPQNKVRVAQWYRKAAERGNPSAQHIMGDMYAAGSMLYCRTGGTGMQGR